jgi:L-iditol 2-dehydrogenase
MLFAQTQHGEATFDPGAVCVDEKTLSAHILLRSAFSMKSRPGLRWLPQRIRSDSADLAPLLDLTKRWQAIEIASHPKADSMKIMIEPRLGCGTQSE